MAKSLIMKSTLIALVCSISFAAYAVANDGTRIEVPAGDLLAALQSLEKQADIEVVYQAEQLKDIRTEGLSGTYSGKEALALLLKGTSLVVQTDEATGVMLITPSAVSPAKTTANAIEGETVRVAQSQDNPVAHPSSEDDQTKQSAGSSPQGSGEYTKLEEIVVTAQKRVERRQDVPVPVTVIDAGRLATTNQLRVQDYYNKIPGLGLTLGGNGNEPIIAIRGITTGGSALGANPTVGIVIDEVSYGASVATGSQFAAVPDIDPGDLARVEVLRGPQGALYGASSIGGLLKFVTIDPSTDALRGRVQVGTVSVSDSDDLGHSIRGSLNVPLGDTFAVRASAFTTRDPGYVDNAQSGRADANRRDSDGARLSALWRPSDALSLKLSALYQDSERLGADEVDTALGSDPSQAYLGQTGIYRNKAQVYTATAIAKLGSVELISATGYSVDDMVDDVDLTNFLPFFGPNGDTGFFADFAQGVFGVDHAATLTDKRVTRFSQEIRASMPIGDRVTWAVGAFYADEGTDAVVDTQGVDDTRTNAGSLVRFVYGDGVFEERAIFTNIAIDLTDRWDIQFGGRFSDHEQHYVRDLSGALFGGALPTLVVRDEGSAFTYLVTPRFKLSSDVMLYARLASGYRPGGPTTNCGLPEVPCGFDPDTTENYEIGIKGSIGGNRFSYDASLYYIDWKDLQLIGVLTPTSGFSYTANASRAESKGLELSVESRLPTGLTVSAWAAYNEAEVAEPFPSGSLFGLPGDRLPFSSRFSGNLSLQQDFPLWGTTSGFVAGTLSYVGDRVGDFMANATRQAYPSYTQVDLSAGMSYESWTLDIFANNVTDKRGVLRTGIDSVFEPSYTNYIRPRTIGLSLSKTF